ncbi:trehalose-6-phosphate synthase, partial [Acinetobacter baumannii]
NLVAKEYVAARHDLDDGALVLSEFTGAAVELEGAVLTNPYSTRNMDAAIDSALDMPADERRERMRRLQDSVARYDASAWIRHMQARFQALRDD